MAKNVKALNEIARRYNLSKELLFVKHEYVGRHRWTWYAIIAQHLESDTCYLAVWNEKQKNEEICIKKYIGTDNEKALCDFYEFIIA